MEANQKASEPSEVTQLRSFLGAVNYYRKFLPDLSTVLAPLYKLLQNSTKWCWGSSQAKAFQSVKKLLTSECVLAHFDPSQDLVLACDASPYGVGAVLLHKYPVAKERPIAFASRSLGDAGKNYSQLEKEGLAIVFGVKKFHQFLCGRPFAITSDHKPLQNIFKETSAIPQMASARIQRWALLGGYDYTISYKPGRQHANTYMLSRLPSAAAPSNIPRSPKSVYLLETMDTSPVTLAQIRQQTSQDPNLSKVREAVVTGQQPHDEILQPYRRVWSELSVKQGCVV